MIKIMFVCHGNICRSPMAEFVMKKIVADNPWYTGNFDVTYTDIDNGCRALLEYIKEHNLKIN